MKIGYIMSVVLLILYILIFFLVVIVDLGFRVCVDYFLLFILIWLWLFVMLFVVMLLELFSLFKVDWYFGVLCIWCNNVGCSMVSNKVVIIVVMMICSNYIFGMIVVVIVFVFLSVLVCRMCLCLLNSWVGSFG